MSWLIPKLGFTKPDNTKRKIELGTGKGLIQWIRLSDSQDLASEKREHVDEVELMKHNSSEDCWILLFDIVYDITRYLEYHPGGIDELLRVAGTDATELFNENHMWVNYNAMLKSCIVGRFVGDKSKLNTPKPPIKVDNDSSQK